MNKPLLTNKEIVFLAVIYFFFMLAPTIFVVLLNGAQFEAFFGVLLGLVLSISLTALIYILNLAFLPSKFVYKSKHPFEATALIVICTGVCFYISLYVGFIFGLICPISKVFVFLVFLGLFELILFRLPDKKPPVNDDYLND